MLSLMKNKTTVPRTVMSFCIICTNRTSLYNSKSTKTSLLFHTITSCCSTYQAQVPKNNCGSTISSRVDSHSDIKMPYSSDGWAACLSLLLVSSNPSNQSKAHLARKCALLGIKDKCQIVCETQTYGLSEGIPRIHHIKFRLNDSGRGRQK